MFYQSHTQVIDLQGCIGAGKSTLLRMIKGWVPEVAISEEPLKRWNSPITKGGESALSAFYGDPKGRGMVFQTFVMLTRVESLSEDCEGWGGAVVCERTSLEMSLFPKLLEEEGSLDEFEMKTVSLLADTLRARYRIRTCGFIYLKVSADVAMRRIARRGRPSEENIQKERIERLILRHDEWCKERVAAGCEVLVLDGDADDPASHKDRVVGFINRLVRRSS